MAFQNKQRNSENSEIETDSENPLLKRSTFFARNMWLNDGGQFVTHKRNDLAGEDTRVDLPSGHWVESKRTQARYLIGNGLDTRFNIDVKMESSGSNYSLVSEGQAITNPDADTINIEWAYSHKEGATTYPSVFKTLLGNNSFKFQFTAPLPDSYRLFLQVTPVISGIASSKLKTNHHGFVYGAEWLLDSGEVLSFVFPKMAGSIDEFDVVTLGNVNEGDTVLLGNTLFLYSDDYGLLAGEGFTFG